MKNKFFRLTFCLLLISSCAYCQSTEELFSDLGKSATDTGKVRLLLSLSEALLVKAGAGKKEIDSAYTFMRQADQLSRAIGHLEGHGRSLVVGALILYKKGEWDKGLASSKQALAVFSKLNDLENEAEATRVIGQYYWRF
jgi:hypothetical protein